MENKDSKSNIGCFVLIVIWIIVSIIYTIKGESTENITEYGKGIILFGGIAIGYMLIRYFLQQINFDREFNKISCIGSIVIGVLVMLGIDKATESFGLSYSVGIIVIIVFIIIIGILFYNNFKDE